MTSAVGSTDSRFSLESHDHAGNFVAALPYANAQADFGLNEKGSELRIEIPFRGFGQVTPANLTEGKHELWFYDNKVSRVDPIFAGPVWDITANSSNGKLSCAAQDPSSYLAKRTLRTTKIYSSTTAASKIADLLSYTNSVYGINISVVIVTNNSQTSSVTYKGIDRNKIADLINSICGQDDGVEYFFRTTNNVHKLMLYGGLIKPSVGINALEWGGNLDGYSVQGNAQNIANDLEVVGSNGRVGVAASTTKQAEYAALYQDVITGSDLTSSTNLNNSAATQLKDRQSAKKIVSLVTRVLTPIKDFDFGSQFATVIKDNYVNINQVIRVTGWQLTIGQGDKITTVLYTKDTEGVS